MKTSSIVLLVASMVWLFAALAHADPLVCNAGCVPAPVATPTPVLGESNIGVDYLGLKINSWDIPTSISLLRDSPVKFPIGVLVDNTFGLSDDHIPQLLATGKVNKLRAHLLNGTCISNGHCYSGDALRGYSWGNVNSEARNPNSNLMHLICGKAHNVEAWHTTYPGTHFYANGILEHHMDATAAQNVANKIHECAPNVTVVDNPIDSYAKLPSTILEKHGLTPNEGGSLDGVEIGDNDVEAYKASCAGKEFCFLWGRTFNGRNNDATWVQPNMRTDFPTADLLKFYDQLRYAPDTAPGGGTPGFCSSLQALSDPILYKTLSEDKGVPDPRRNKPLFISRSTSDVDALTTGGQKIGFFRFYGSYTVAGLFRSYSGTGSGQSAKQLGDAARAATGSSWIYLKNAQGVCYLTDAYRRRGYFHP